ncbi:hypothetical protein CROQUDRAFT_92261 [Cronartium quercuum f. sp. fusiforme G11]|uniref:Uncharacterized protein n=1 Tax=Cronartium quercuum f. sp. fusiforme G11 TaxID=708437 RepID=A0A9P6NMI6_9BASI|nr:hypothetical protein CROQUDRAFT_92261 [Cronartium quercuum f. sp. fusiforme G11]
MDISDALDALDTCVGHQSWADEVAEAEAACPQMMEDNLMDMWLKATKHTGDYCLERCAPSSPMCQLARG